MAFRGLITPEQPALYPGLPQGAGLGTSNKKSGSGSSKADDAPDGMVRQTTDYNIAEAQLNQRRVSNSNKMLSILRNKYHGDTQAFVRDEDVQNIMREYQTQKASLSAVKNQVESEKGYKEAAVLKTEENEGSDKYAVDNRGRRMIMGVDGKSYSEGESYTTPDGKEHKAHLKTNSKGEKQDYLTYGEMYDTDEKNMRVTTNDYGEYTLDQRKWDTSIDYKVDHLADFAGKNKQLAGMASWGGGSYKGMMGGSHIKISGGGKSNVSKINGLTKQMVNAVPSEVKAQVNQEYWEKGYDRGADLVMSDKGSSFIPKQYTDGVKAGKSASDLGLSKKEYDYIKNGKVVTNENAKKDFYAASRIEQTMQETTTHGYDSPKFLKLTEGEFGANFDKTKRSEESTAEQIALRRAKSETESIVKSVHVPVGDKGGSILVDFNTGIVIANPDQIREQNAADVIKLDKHTDSDGEIDFNTFTDKDSMFSRGDYIILPNGQYITDPKLLKSTFAIGMDPNTVAMPDMIRNKKGKLVPAISVTEDKDGNYLTNGEGSVVKLAGGHWIEAVIDYEVFQDEFEHLIKTQKRESNSSYADVAKGQKIDNSHVAFASGEHENVITDDSGAGNSLTQAAYDYGFRTRSSDGTIYNGALVLNVWRANDKASIDIQTGGPRNTPSIGNQELINTLEQNKLVVKDNTKGVDAVANQ